MMLRLLSLIGVVGIVACSTLPSTSKKVYSFPKEAAFIGNVKRSYKTLGLVRAKVNYPSLDPAREEAELCQNYFNKAARDLIHMAKEKGGDAVIDLKSVVFLEDGRQETYSTPECSDDGMEGQVLAQAIAVKWIEPAHESGGVLR